MRRTLPWIWTGFVAAATLALFLVGWEGDVETAGLLLLPSFYTALGALIATR